MSSEKRHKSRQTDTADKPLGRTPEDTPDALENTAPVPSETDSLLLQIDDELPDGQENAAILDEANEPSPDDLEEIRELELADTTRGAPLESIDDPVRMYLREIGRVPLLEPYHEIWLSTQREAAIYLKDLQARLCEQSR